MSDNQISSVCRFSAKSAQKAALILICTYFVWEWGIIVSEWVQAGKLKSYDMIDGSNKRHLSSKASRMALEPT